MTASDIVSGRIAAGDRAEISSLAFLAEASAVLSASLDYQATLTHLAELVVPRLADWCVVRLALDGGALRPVVVAHTDAAKAEMLRTLQQHYPVDPEASVGPGAVLRSGEPSYHPDIGDEVLGSVARDADHLRLLRSIGTGAAVIVPLTTRDRCWAPSRWPWSTDARGAPTTWSWLASWGAGPPSPSTTPGSTPRWRRLRLKPASRRRCCRPRARLGSRACSWCPRQER